MAPEAWKILVIEDDEDDYFITRELLAQAREQRYKFTWARTAAAGRAALQTGAFDAVLMDERLPDGSGLELIREAVAAGERAPIIMLTGQGSYELDLEVMRSGAADYLSKGEVTGPLLERAIRYAIERKLSETERERLTLENERQRRLVDSILEVDPGGIALVSGPDLTFKFANPAYRAQTPRPEIDPVGRPYASIWPDEEPFLRPEDLRRVIQTGQPAHFPSITMIDSSGGTRSFTPHAYPLPDVDPTAILLVVWEVDLPAGAGPRLPAEDVEKRGLEEIGVIFSSISYAVVVYDLRGTPLYANQAAISNLGFDPVGMPRQELIGRVSFHSRDGEALDPETLPVVRALAGDVVQEMTMSFGVDQAHEQLVSISSAPLRRDGVQVGALVIWHPFTQPELTEGELRAAQARMNSLLQALPVAVWIVDAQGQTVARNAQADRLWAGEMQVPDETDHYGAYKLFNPDTGEEIPADARPLERAIWHGEVTSGERYGIQRLDGSLGVILAFAGPIQLGEGERLGGVVVDLDITEQDRLEKITLEQKNELERSNRDLQDFASIVSHDLKEPLRKITGFGELLVRRHREGLSEEGQDYIGRMIKAAERMQRMIDDLLAYSRVSTRGRPFETVDLNQVTADVLETLDMRIEQTGGRVDVGPLPTIQADPSQMKHLLQNLIGNALKFHRPDVPPVVEVRAGERKDGSVTVTVADNGIGFDEQSLDKLFLPFSRLHGRGEYEGSGIGLAICRKIVERHGGSITAHSRAGEGSTFVVVLPREQAGD